MNCALARAGKIAPQLQSSIAISGDGESWWLINASPDLTAQIEKFAPLQAHKKNSRSSPIAGVLLTNADLDHTIGILLVRQRDEPVPVHATDDIRSRLRWLEGLMQRFCGIEWRDVPGGYFQLMKGVEVRGLELRGSVAFEIKSSTGRHALVAPAVSIITPELDRAIKAADDIFFDGTFWSNEELLRFRPNAKTAMKMGHIPVENTLPLLSESDATRTVYLHINNTNPILTPGSPERRKLEATGAMVSYDGLELEL